MAWTPAEAAATQAEPGYSAPPPLPNQLSNHALRLDEHFLGSDQAARWTFRAMAPGTTADSRIVNAPGKCFNDETNEAPVRARVAAMCYGSPDGLQLLSAVCNLRTRRDSNSVSRDPALH
jgi:hypothetical protein